MTFLFYLLTALLFLWAGMTIAQLGYSLYSNHKRRLRADIRARFRAALQQIYVDAGRPELVTADEVVSALRRIAGDERAIGRDVLVEFASRLEANEAKPLVDAYEMMGFVKQDIERLQKGYWQQRADAATRLGRIRCWSAIEVLNGALRDSDEEVRLAAVCALAEIGDQYSIPAIVHALAGANGWQVLQVSEKLLAMNADISHIFLEMLNTSGAVKSRREAVIKTVLELIADFGQRGSERLNLNAARTAACQFIQSDQIDLRARAIRALAAVGIGTVEEFQLLLAALSDKNWEIRAVAAKALGQIGNLEAIPKLTEALTDEAWWVRHNSAQALTRMGQPGIAALRAQLDQEDRFAREIAKQVLEELQLDAASRA
ncbi:MAG: HEAT repeat domain-containing protein [Candidatus Bathyarchaeia archaeon]